MKTTLLCFSLAASGLAQTSRPAFEVASVKLNQQFSQAETVDTSPGTLTMRSVTLITAMMWAYRLQAPQISGPGWLDSQRYDIFAKAPRPAKDAEMRPMLQTLLAERFNLAVHREDRVMTVPALLVGKGGPKMKESVGDGPSKSTKDLVRGAIIIEGAPMSDLVEQLAKDLSTPVLDLTGLKGRYDFNLNIAAYLPPRSESGRGAAPAPVDPADVIQAMLQGELGLNLESRKASVEILVIEHAEKSPTEN